MAIQARYRERNPSYVKSLREVPKYISTTACALPRTGFVCHWGTTTQATARSTRDVINRLRPPPPESGSCLQVCAPSHENGAKQFCSGVSRTPCQSIHNEWAAKAWINAGVNAGPVVGRRFEYAPPGFAHTSYGLLNHDIALTSPSPDMWREHREWF